MSPLCRPVTTQRGFGNFTRLQNLVKFLIPLHTILPPPAFQRNKPDSSTNIFTVCSETRIHDSNDDTNSLCPNIFSTTDIFDVLRAFDPSKVCDLDGIQGKLLPEWVFFSVVCFYSICQQTEQKYKQSKQKKNKNKQKKNKFREHDITTKIYNNFNYQMPSQTGMSSLRE